MAKVKFQLSRKGVIELMQSPKMKDVCEKYANRALNSLGEGYVVTTYTGTTRVNASIFAETYEAKRENFENNTILKALRG